MRILVTGASSQVAFAILESLEGRRAGLELVGIASESDNSEAIRFDVFELVPQSADPGFRAVLERVIDAARPDLVIPARDDDIGHLAALASARPELAATIVAGGPAAAEIVTDKSRTARFARDRDLVWADTLVCGNPREAEHGAADRFAARNPFPWIVKPAAGAGSRGVFVIIESRHAEAWLQRPGYIIQPLLGPARAEIAPLAPELGLPWFIDLGDPWLRSIQVVVLPDGSVGPSVCSDHTLRGGAPQTSAIADDPAATEIGRRWARALAAEGWRGSLNIQMKVDPRLGPVPFEINGRMSGATHGRLALGFDEVGIVLDAWAGWRLPRRPPTATKVHYRLRAYP